MTNQQIFESLKKLHKDFCALYDKEGLLVGIQSESIQITPEFFAWLSEGEDVKCNRNGQYIQLGIIKDDIQFLTLIG